jgi:hypothetical protein
MKTAVVFMDPVETAIVDYCKQWGRVLWHFSWVRCSSAPYGLGIIFFLRKMLWPEQRYTVLRWQEIHHNNKRHEIIHDEEIITVPAGVHKPWWYHSSELLLSDEINIVGAFLKYIVVSFVPNYYFVKHFSQIRVLLYSDILYAPQWQTAILVHKHLNRKVAIMSLSCDDCQQITDIKYDFPPSYEISLVSPLFASLLPRATWHARVGGGSGTPLVSAVVTSLTYYKLRGKNNIVSTLPRRNVREDAQNFHVPLDCHALEDVFGHPIPPDPPHGCIRSFG